MNFNFWGFSDKIYFFGGMRIFGYFWGVITKVALYFIFISMHFRVFS